MELACSNETLVSATKLHGYNQKIAVNHHNGENLKILVKTLLSVKQSEGIAFFNIFLQKKMLMMLTRLSNAVGYTLWLQVVLILSIGGLSTSILLSSAALKCMESTDLHNPGTFSK
jgi:hypothetical protein